MMAVYINVNPSSSKTQNRGLCTILSRNQHPTFRCHEEWTPLNVPGSFEYFTFSVQNDNGHDNERYQGTECSNCTNSNGCRRAITRIEIHSSGHSLGRLLLVSCIRSIMQDTQGIDYRFTVLVPSWYMGADVNVKSPAVILPICTWLPCWMLCTRKLLIVAALILHRAVVWSGAHVVCTYPVITSPFWSNKTGPAGPTKLVLNVFGFKYWPSLPDARDFRAVVGSVELLIVWLNPYAITIIHE